MDAERPRLRRRFRRRVTPPCFRLYHNSIDWSFRTRISISSPSSREKRDEERRRALEGEMRLMALYVSYITGVVYTRESRRPPSALLPFSLCLEPSVVSLPSTSGEYRGREAVTP